MPKATSESQTPVKYLRNPELREEIVDRVGGEMSESGLRKSALIRVAESFGVEDAEDMELTELYDAICEVVDESPPDHAGCTWGMPRDALKATLKRLRELECDD